MNYSREHPGTFDDFQVKLENVLDREESPLLGLVYEAVTGELVDKSP